MQFVLVNEGSQAPLTAQVTEAWLAQVAASCTIQLNRDVSPAWGGSYAVRAGMASQIAPGEVVFSMLDALPNAPGAVAYHDVNGQAVPVAYLGLATCSTLDDVSVAISHELCETAGDAGCNLWADTGQAREFARELCDAVEGYSYDIAGVKVSDFVLPSFFVPNAPGPYSYTESVGGMRVVSGPFATAMGGYQITRDASGTETQVHGIVRAFRADKLAHWSSRAARRGSK